MTPAAAARCRRTLPSHRPSAAPQPPRPPRCSRRPAMALPGRPRALPECDPIAAQITATGQADGRPMPALPDCARRRG